MRSRDYFTLTYTARIILSASGDREHRARVAAVTFGLGSQDQRPAQISRLRGEIVLASLTNRQLLTPSPQNYPPRAFRPPCRNGWWACCRLEALHLPSTEHRAKSCQWAPVFQRRLRQFL